MFRGCGLPNLGCRWTLSAALWKIADSISSFVLFVSSLPLAIYGWLGVGRYPCFAGRPNQIGATLPIDQRLLFWKNSCILSMRTPRLSLSIRFSPIARFTRRNQPMAFGDSLSAALEFSPYLRLMAAGLVAWMGASAGEPPAVVHSKRRNSP